MAARPTAEVQTPHGDYHDLWIDPKNPTRHGRTATMAAPAMTFNGGRAWSSLDNQPTAQFYAVITDNGVPYRIYGSQQDNTTVSIASRTNGAGITENDWHPVGGGESGYLAPTGSTPPVVFGGSYFGLLTRYDERTGESRNVTIWPDYNGGRTAAQIKYRFQWTYPIIVSPHDGTTVYAGRAGRLPVDQRRSELGRHQPRPDAQRQGQAERRAPRRVSTRRSSRSPSQPREKGVIWTGSDDGLVHVTRNGGRELAKRDASGRAAVHAHQHHRGVTARCGHRVSCGEPLSAGRLPPLHLQDHGLRQHRGRRSRPAFPSAASSGRFARIQGAKGLLFAGTETGVYYSLNDGAAWQPLQLNLPVVPITDLTITNDDLVAATQGRAFWVLDDITPLRALNDARRRPIAQLVSRLATPFARGGPASAAARPACRPESARRRDRDLLAWRGARQ